MKLFTTKPLALLRPTFTSVVESFIKTKIHTLRAARPRAIAKSLPH